MSGERILASRNGHEMTAWNMYSYWFVLEMKVLLTLKCNIYFLTIIKSYVNQKFIKSRFLMI